MQFANGASTALRRRLRSRSRARESVEDYFRGHRFQQGYDPNEFPLSADAYGRTITPISTRRFFA